MKRREILCLLGGVLALSTFRAYAADQDREREENRERVYGWELMSDAERAEYRERMRSMHTQAEREAFRLKHHKEMEERAKKRGLTLHEVPMGPGMMGPGHGPGMMGPGMGPGSGMGPGGGMGPRN